MRQANSARLLVVIALLGVYVAACYFAYSAGAKNQWYYDAPSRVLLYENLLALDDEASRLKLLERMIMNQRCILATDDRKISLLMNHPVHIEVKSLFSSQVKKVCSDRDCGCIEKMEEL